MTKRKPLNIRAVIRDDESIVECDKSCEECEYYKECSRIDTEVLRYAPDARSFGVELAKKTTLMPSIETASEERARKLYAVLCELHIGTQLNKPWNAHDVAVNLGISVYRVRQRLKYLVDHNFVSKDSNTYKFSFGRSVSLIIKHYVNEFNRRFGYAPVVGAQDGGILTALLKEYSDDDVKRMISGYLDTKDDFIIKNGYSLRFFPSRINSILIDMSKSKAKPKPKVTLNITQLDAYRRGKAEGKWTGNEDWAIPYEEALKNVPA